MFSNSRSSAVPSLTKGMGRANSSLRGFLIQLSLLLSIITTQPALSAPRLVGSFTLLGGSAGESIYSDFLRRRPLPLSLPQWSWEFRNGRGRVSAKIANSGRVASGTLRLQLLLCQLPFGRGGSCYVIMTSRNLSPLSGGYARTDAFSGTVPLKDIQNGIYYVVLALREFSTKRSPPYALQAGSTSTTPVIVGTAPTPPPGQPLSRRRSQALSISEAQGTGHGSSPAPVETPAVAPTARPADGETAVIEESTESNAWNKPEPDTSELDEAAAAAAEAAGEIDPNIEEPDAAETESSEATPLTDSDKADEDEGAEVFADDSEAATEWGIPGAIRVHLPESAPSESSDEEEDSDE